MLPSVGSCWNQLKQPVHEFLPKQTIATFSRFPSRDRKFRYRKRVCYSEVIVTVVKQSHKLKSCNFKSEDFASGETENAYKRCHR